MKLSDAISVIVVAIIAMWMGFALAQTDVEPQPRLRLRGNFDVIEFANGSQWYLKEGSVQAIWGVPRDQQKKLGFKTKIYGSSYNITLNKEITDILRQLYRNDQEQLQELLDRIDQIDPPE